MQFLRVPVLVFLLLITNFCHAAPSVVGKEWYLTSINSVPIELMKFDQEKPFISLMEDGRYSAYAGCNRIMGGYKLEGEELTFSKAAMTMMACQDNMDFEQTFVKMLDEVRYWNVEGNEHSLNFKAADLTILAVFDDAPSTLPTE